jgi:hypothetical protein
LGLFWSNEPPRFSLEAQPTASNPAIAVNAINFFISTPFVSDQLPPQANCLNQAFTQETPKIAPSNEASPVRRGFWTKKATKIANAERQGGDLSPMKLP